MSRKVSIHQNIHKEFYKKIQLDIVFAMPKPPIALSQMPPVAATGLRQLGADLAVARLRRKESLAAWAARIGTSVPTLMRMEAGEAGVGIGL